MIMVRPVTPRAKRSTDMVASVPELTKRTCSTGIRSMISVAELPRKGARPVAVSYITTPSENPGGTEDDVAEVRRLLAGCGALEATEARIGELLGEAKTALAAARGIDETARATLAALADHVTDRSA
jgi:geranylgeranyl pyrophosphate synthase